MPYRVRNIKIHLFTTSRIGGCRQVYNDTKDNGDVYCIRVGDE